MISFALAASLLTSLASGPWTMTQVVAWGDTTSPLLRNFPDSLSPPRWVQACGNRSLAYRFSRKLVWWGAGALDPVQSPSHRLSPSPSQSKPDSQKLWKIGMMT